MHTRKRDGSLGLGVFYSPGDYVGILRRMVIFAVDGVILACLWFGLAILWFAISASSEWLLSVTFFFIVWLYVAVFKPSRFRTVGYWVSGCRIVNLRGQRPSILRMTFRSLLWLLGPLHFIFDLVWCGIDDDQQTLRDRFSGTCVINKDAAPIGNGEIHLTHFNTMGYTLTYPHVVHPRQSNAGNSKTAL